MANPRVKQWTALLTRKGREEQQAYLLEGIHLVKEALLGGGNIHTVLYDLERGVPREIEPLQHQSANLSAAGVEWIGVSQAVLAKCTDTRTPQGVVGICGKPALAADRLLDQKDALVVVVDGLQDPGNLGTIIRTADAVGATGVLLGKGTVDLYNPKTVRATMGSLFHLPVVECELRELLPKARAKGICLVGTRLGAPRHCYELDLKQPTWFLMGNEGSGLSPDIAAYVDLDVIIPMRGQAESLNVAMAASVLLYEAMRQRYYSSNNL